jgi:hypothetical protein
MAHGTSVLLFSHLFSLVLFLGLIDINSRFIFYAEITMTRQGDLIDVLKMNMIMMRRGPVVTGDEDAELYDLAVSFFSSQLSCIPLGRLFTSS